MRTLFDVLHRHWLERQEAVCLVILQAGRPDREMTYRELISGAAAYALAYEKANVQPGEVVLIILQHGLELVYAFWGAVLHGAVPTIMPFLTEKLIPERYRSDLATLIDITKPAAVVTYADFEIEIQAARRPSDSFREVLVVEEISTEVEPRFDTLCGSRRTSSDYVLLQHSSGTTGLQKGVALSHEAVLNQLDSYAEALHLDFRDVIVSWLPLYHDMGLIAGFLQPLLMGVKLVLMSPFDWVRAPHRLLQAVGQYQGTLVWLPNFAYNFCAQKIRDRYLEGVSLTSLRAVINCSEPMREESQRQFAERFKPFGFQERALATSYAMAENVFAVTQGGIDEPVRIDAIDRERFQVENCAVPAMEGRAALRMVSAGKPVRGTEVMVIGPKGQPLPERWVGELVVRSNCMLSEYYHRPDETAKAFWKGWYLTGDTGYLADGEVFVSGRKKDLLIIAGKNIYPQDLERLAMEVPGIHPGRVVAFGVFNETSGTEEAVIAAEVDSDDPSERERIGEEIRAMVTRGSAISLNNVYLVGSKWLIKTSSGKIARLANREHYLAEIAAQGDCQGR
jgi:fatty-acyl-CoA synthase